MRRGRKITNSCDFYAVFYLKCIHQSYTNKLKSKNFEPRISAKKECRSLRNSTPKSSIFLSDTSTR